MTKSEQAWQKWAATDPYYGVLSSDEYRKDNLSPEKLQEFFRSGEEHIEGVFRTIRQHLDPQFSPRTALDFGCGTGRLVLPLARRCQQVVGIDVAPAMLDEAARNCAELTNVKLQRPEDPIHDLHDIDLVHSFIVFQHIPVKQGFAAMTRMVDALAPGGCMALHVTIGRQGSWIRKSVFWARHHIPGAHRIIQLMLGRPPSDPPMQMNHYPLNAIVQYLHAAGIGGLKLEMTDHGGFIGTMVYGRKLRPQLPGENGSSQPGQA